jgi:cysteine synthase
MTTGRELQDDGLIDDRMHDRGAYERAVERLRAQRALLPTFAELADPSRISPAIRESLASVDPDIPHPLNLFRVHWQNASDRVATTAVPDYAALPTSLTGVPATILVAFGNRFPMIRAHKVLAAYGCLVPRLVTGRFDPTAHRAVWPSTGNYCRGGVAISRILGCRGVAVLPAGMSAERFQWLERWVADPSDIIRTPGTESNVKEIYDKCAELRQDGTNVILNQFAEFGNYLVHHDCTGSALERVFQHAQAATPGLRLRAFTSATGSAGTIGAGDYLKARHGSRIVAVEALECPTMLRNGFGEHNIQGIGDKHIPLIHNVMNTDLVAAVSDRATDRLGLLFNHPAGREYLRRRRAVPGAIIDALSSIGLSGICNILAAIKTARYYGMGPDDAVVTVATDGAELYASERDLAIAKYYPAGFDEVGAAEAFGEHLLGASTDHLIELRETDRHRIFNLGYYTWVEQQGVTLADFERRRHQGFWADLRTHMARWDEQIREFNARTGLGL